MAEKYSLKIFNNLFELATSDGKKEDLVKVAKYYKKVTENLKEAHPKRPDLEIAVLAGLRITDELYNILKKSENTNNTSQAAPDTRHANSLINQALKELELSLKL